MNTSKIIYLSNIYYFLMSDPNADVNPQESEEMNDQQVASILQSLSQEVVSDTNEQLVVDGSIKERVVEI